MVIRFGILCITSPGMVLQFATPLRQGLFDYKPYDKYWRELLEIFRKDFVLIASVNAYVTNFMRIGESLSQDM